MSRRRKIIIDTDPGIDDALAIFLALASPEIEVVGLTSVFGNAEIEVTTRNALALLEIAERPDIPVAAGAAKPLVGAYKGAVPHIHEADGQGDSGVLTPKRAPLALSAAEFLVEAAAAAPGKVTIVAIGPLTNLALALTIDPDIQRNVERVVIMGGAARVPGNVNKAAEANIFNDPEAADAVFAADWPVVMVGLDVTHHAFLADPMIARIAASPRATGRHVSKALPLYRRFYEDAHNLEGVYLHDPSAVAYLIDPTLFKTKSWPIRVALDGESRGKTVPLIDAAGDAGEPSDWQGRRAVDVCVAVDAHRLIELVVERLT